MPITSYTPSTLVGEQAAQAMAPWLTPELALLLDGIGAMFQQTASIAQDVGTDNTVGFDPAINGFDVVPYTPGYGTIFNPSTCPAADLPFLGQFVGVEVPVGQDYPTALSLVTTEAGLQRGTPAAIIAAAKRNLTGTQSVTLIERVRPDGVADAYWFILIVRPEECPSAANLTAAVNLVKPGGVMWQLVQQDAWTWAQASNQWQQDSMTWQQTTNQHP